MNGNIEQLQDTIRQLEKSEDNKRRNNYWKPSGIGAEAYWHGRPVDGLNIVPITIEPEHEMWSKMLEFNLGQYYADGLHYLLADLNMKVYRFENFKDGTPIGRNISMWMGSGFESSLFGVEQEYRPGQDPWIGREPGLKKKSDLEKLRMPGFFDNGAMKTVHEMYADMKANLDEDFTVIVPEWCRGPFGVACHLRGMEQICMDMVDDPPFVHEFMKFLNEARKRWTKERADFMNVPIQRGSLYNDEVNVPVVSPRLYEEFVLPYELELCDFHGGMTYWHSCGNVAPLLDAIKTIPNLEMVHISPWTDLKKAVEILEGTGIALEVVLQPYEDVQSATGEQMSEQLRSIKRDVAGFASTVRADGLQLLTNVEQDVRKIKQWADLANTILVSAN